MRNLGSTLSRLAALRPLPMPGSSASGPDRLSDLTAFGTNPGALRARTYVPADLAPGAPLVVVLHGCTQTAAAYDRGSGWSRLADEAGFALLFPEQQRGNNANLCFNWFSPADNRRDAGEALSIRQMISALVAAHKLDASRIFVTGLSAGGAMTSIMLATYPELFAGGAIIAGLPFGTAASVGDAFARMAGRGYPANADLAELVRAASAHNGPWPRISVWHGDRDTTVDPSNADRIVGQWRPLHGVTGLPTKQERTDGHLRRSWSNASGRVVIEEVIVTGMGHGTPLDTLGKDACGEAGPHMLEAGISSTRHIAAFWGLSEAGARRSVERQADLEPARSSGRAPRAAAERAPKGVGAIIEDALRAAGLMR
jgi:poly(hydroxyalkanoate) depolymerase family esterase